MSAPKRGFLRKLQCVSSVTRSVPPKIEIKCTTIDALMVGGAGERDRLRLSELDDRSVRRTYRLSSDRRRDDTLVAYLLEKVLRLAATRKTAMVLLMNTEVLNASFIKPEAWASMNGR